MQNKYLQTYFDKCQKGETMSFILEMMEFCVIKVECVFLITQR